MPNRSADAGPSAAPTRTEVTRSRLIETATEVFAEGGFAQASLLEITRLAGQQNRGAVHYHFGSREGLLVAVLRQHDETLATEHPAWLSHALSMPGDLRAAVEASIRPLAKVAGEPAGGRFLQVAIDVLRATASPDLVAAAAASLFDDAVDDLVVERMSPAMPSAARVARWELMRGFMVTSIADSGRVGSRPDIDVDNLITMTTGALSAT